MLLLYEERPLSEQGARCHASDLLPQGESLASAEDLIGGTVTPTEFPQRHPTPSAPAADVFPSVDSGLVSLVSTVGKLAKLAGGTGGRAWSSRYSAWRVGRSARNHSCRAVSLVRRFPGPPCAIPEAAHSSSAGNADPSMPHEAERGMGSGPESNAAASLGEAVGALLQRAIRQPDSGCEVSAATASSVARVGEDRPVRRWQSAWGCAARAPEAHSRVEPFAGDSGPPARNTAGPGRAAWRAVVLSQACSRQGFAGGVRLPCLADDDRHLVSGARPAAGCHASAGAGFPVASKAAQATACHPNKQWT